MPYSDDFKPLLRKFRRSLGFDPGTETAIEEANKLGIEIEQPRKQRTKRNKQKGTDPFESMLDFDSLF